MKRQRSLILGLVLLALAAGSPASGQTLGQAEQPKPPQQEEKQGTGVVPPGVKLVPKRPAASRPRPYTFPNAATRTLPNGLRVFVVSNSEQPAVTVRLVLTAAGAIHDPAGKPGVAEMTANLLNQGTATRTAPQIAEAIDFVGGSLSASADSDGTYVTATVVKKDLGLAMELLSDVVLHAAFQKEELDRRRQQLLSGLRIQYADPEYLASVIFKRVVFGQHPYGLPSEGTPESAAKLEREDLARFRDTYYVPNHALLAFAGDITPQAAFAAAEKFLGAWPRKELPAAAPAAPAPSRGWRVFLVDKPDAVQTQIRVGRLGIPRNSADYIPLYVTNRIFGGGYNSRLNTQVRIRKGLTYGAGSAFESRRLAGSFVASTFTRTEATVEATRLVVDLLGKMATGEVTPEELDFARDYLAGVFPIQTETAEQVAGRILAVAQYELPADYNEKYPERILAVGREQVKAMAGKYFASSDLDLVLVGNVGQFRDAIRKEFPNAKFEEMPFDQVDLLAGDLRRPKETVAAATPESLARGKAVLLKGVEAAGGAAALGKIESLEFSGPAEFVSPQGPLQGDVRVQMVLPDRIRIEAKLPFGMIVQGYDGKSGWLASPQGAVEVPANLQAEFQRGIDLEAGLGLFRQALAGKIEAQFLGEEEVDGKKVLAIEWNSPAGKTRLYFDAETGLLIGAKYRQVTMRGVVETEQRWSDFRVVEGLRFPYRWLTLRDAAKYSDQTIQEVKLNPKPDPALFSKPQ